MRAMMLSAFIAALSVTTAFAAPPKKAPARQAAAKAVSASRLSKPISPPPMWSVAFSPDGTKFAVGSYTRVLVYDAFSGLKTGDYVVSKDAVRSVAYSPDGKCLAAGTGIPAESGSAVVLDTATGKPLRTIESHEDTVEAVAWADNADLLTAADDEKVNVTDIGTGKTVGTLSEHIGRCLSVAVPTKVSDTAGGAIFATGGADKMVKIWDAVARRVVVNFDQAGCPIWSLAPLGHAGAFIGGCDDGKVRWFTVRTVGGKSNDGVAERSGNADKSFAAHEGAVYAVAAAPNDAFIVSGGADKRVVEWGPNGGKKREWKDAARDVWGVAVSPDSTKIAAASLDGRTRIYDALSGALIFTVDTSGPITVAPPVPAAAVVPVRGAE